MIAFMIICNLIAGLSHKLEKVTSIAATPEVEATKELTALQDKLKEKFSSPDEVKRFLEQRPALGAIVSFLSILIMCGLASGVILLIVYVYLRSKGRELIKPTHKHKTSKWDFLDVAKVVITLFFFGHLLSLGEIFFKKIFGVRPLSEDIRMLFHTSFSDILIIGLVVCFVIKKYGQKISEVGLSLKDWGRNILIGFLGYIAILPILAIVLFGVVWVIELIGWRPPVQPVVGLFLRQTNPKVLFYMTVFVSIMGPLAEEIFFRGFTYKAIRGKLGVKASLLVVAVLFAWLHADVVGFFPILVLGILLGFLYEKTGSLIPSFTVHILHNSLTVSFIFIFKQLLKTIA